MDTIKYDDIVTNPARKRPAKLVRDMAAIIERMLEQARDNVIQVENVGLTRVFSPTQLEEHEQSLRQVLGVNYNDWSLIRTRKRKRDSSEES